MVDGFDSSGTNLIIGGGGKIKLSTAAPQFNRVPQAALTLTTTVTFPDMLKGYNYYYSTFASSHGTAEQCIVGDKLIGQEWGPPALGFTANPLADIDLGPAPDGCDYLDVQCNLTRTTAPINSVFGAGSYYSFYFWPIEFIQGQWLQLTDAALVVEHEQGFSRMFWFEIVRSDPADPTSGRILLRRKQSVVAVDSAGTLVPNDGKVGFEFTFISQSGTNITKLNDPGLNQLGPTHVNGTGCKSGTNTNTQSVYSGTFKIVPCCTI